MDMNIMKYRAFVETVESGSFTKAAALLNYSQSGISRMINDLEREWNVSLLERSRSGVYLTSDGTDLLPYAKNVCREYEKLKMEVDGLSGLTSGIIRIGTFSSVATHRLPKIIKKFRKDYPNIDYELVLGDYTEIEEYIAEGRVDCGFLLLPTAHDFDTAFIEQDTLMAVLPQDHPLAKLDTVPITSLCSDPFLLLQKGAKAEVAELLDRSGIVPDIRLTTWDDYAIMSMVESGLGISILPELILKRIPYRVAIRPLDVPAYRNIGIAMRDRKTASLAVRKFLEYLPLS